jgi:dienelactone hydrolase
MMTEIIVALVLGVAARSPGGRQAVIAPLATRPLRLTFTEQSPLSKLDVLLTRIDANGPEVAPPSSVEYDVSRESFEVFVPASYRPDVPHGLFVWTGVAPVPPAWQKVFTRHKLICISAYPKSPAAAFARARMPLDAVYNMKRLYTVDEARLYVSGFSAGGGVAALLLRAFPDVFSGGYFLMGGVFYVAHKAENGQWEPTLNAYPPTWKGDLDEIKKTKSLVLMRGGRDRVYSALEDRVHYDALLLDGFERVEYIVVPRWGHSPPDAVWFERGLIALECSPPKTPPITCPTQEANPTPGQIAQAQRLLATAQMEIDRVLEWMRKMLKKRDVSWAEAVEKYPQRAARARNFLKRVTDEYPTTPAAAKARQLLADLDEGITAGSKPRRL